MSSNSSFGSAKLAYGGLIIGAIIPGKMLYKYFQHLAGEIPFENVLALNPYDMGMSLMGRTLGYSYNLIAGHPAKWVKDASGISPISNKAPYKDLAEGNLLSYGLNRAYLTASTNVNAALGVVSAKLLVGTILGAGMLGPVPLLSIGAVSTAAGAASVFAATYTSIYAARLCADLIMDFTGLRQLSPANQAKSLGDTRNMAMAPAMAR